MSSILGIALGLCAAAFKSTKSITTKIASTGSDIYTTSFFTRIIGVIIFSVLVFIFKGYYLPTPPEFWISAVINSIILGLTTLIFAKALEISDISLISPIMSLLPVVTIFPAIVLLNEIPSVWGFLGLISITVGAYLISLDQSSDSYLQPIISLKDDQGVRLAVFGLVIAAIIPSIDKIGIQNSDPLTWVLATHIGSSVILIIFMLLKTPNISSEIKRNWKVLILVGLSSSIIWIFQSYGYTYTHVAYVSGAKRTSILLSVIAGYYIFGERNIRQRLIGSGFILIGVLLIILGL